MRKLRIKRPARHRAGDNLRREDRRALFFAEARLYTPYVAVSLGDQLFFVQTSDGGVGKGVFVKGWRKDLSVLDSAIARLSEYGLTLPENPVFVDVGANIGTTTVLALSRRLFTSAVAVEPAPENFRTLRINVVANDLDSRVQLIAAAVTDREGEVAFDVSRSNSGGHRIASGADAAQTVRVAAVTLDRLVERGVIDPDRAGLLWIDAVGHEGNVLAGAERLLATGLPVVIGVRRNLRLAPEVRDAAISLVKANYTDVVELRDFLARHPVDEFGNLVDSFRHTTDLLLVRR